MTLPLVLKNGALLPKGSLSGLLFPEWVQFRSRNHIAPQDDTESSSRKCGHQDAHDSDLRETKGCSLWRGSPHLLYAPPCPNQKPSRSTPHKFTNKLSSRSSGRVGIVVSAF